MIHSHKVFGKDWVSSIWSKMLCVCQLLLKLGSVSIITSYFSNNYLNKHVNLVNPKKLINLEYDEIIFLLLLNSDYSVKFFRD